MPSQPFNEAPTDRDYRKFVADAIKAGFRDVLDEARVRDIFDPCVDDDVILYGLNRADKGSEPADIGAAR